MTTKLLGFQAPVSLFVLEGATTPNPGIPGVWIWSIAEDAMMLWTGAVWRRVAGRSSSVTINCRVASTGNLNLASVTVVDGITLAVGDLVLVKNQTAPLENAVLGFTGTALTYGGVMPQDARAVSGQLITVSEGTVNYDSLWMLTTNNNPIVGTTAMNFKTLGTLV